MLLVGMKGLGAEVAKNLILAGVKGLTMLDHEQVGDTPPSPRLPPRGTQGSSGAGPGATTLPLGTARDGRAVGGGTGARGAPA